MVLKFVSQGEHGTLQLCLFHRDGQVAASFFQDAARAIGGAAQASGDGVGKIDGDQNGINIVHVAQVDLAGFDVAPAQLVKQVAAQLAHRCSQAVEVGGPANAKLFRAGQRLMLDKGAEGAGLGKFFLCVLYEASKVDILMVAQVNRHFLEQVCRLRQQVSRRLEVLSV